MFQRIIDWLLRRPYTTGVDEDIRKELDDIFAEIAAQRAPRIYLLPKTV